MQQLAGAEGAEGQVGRDEMIVQLDEYVASGDAAQCQWKSFATFDYTAGHV